MDGSKSETPLLEMFPPEIWASIALFVPGEALERLKISGSKSLWNRLTLPAGVKSVNLGREFLEFRSWPSFLNDFESLEELHVNFDKCSRWPQQSMRLNLVPKKLRKLVITMRSGEMKNFFVDSNGGALYLDEHVPHLELLDLSVADYSWLSRVPPSLTSLKIDSWAGDVELPASLVHLEITTMSLSQPLTEGQLPSSLETLTTRFVNRIEFLVSKLPSSFCQLKVITRIRAIPAGFSPSQLPRTMTSLDYLIFEPTVLPTEMVALFPPSLTKMHVENVLPSSSWPTLPSSLKTLHFQLAASDCAASENGNNPIYPFELLPRSITDLEVVASKQVSALLEVNPSSLSKPSSSVPLSTPFPPHLMRFSAPKHQFTSNTAKCLPLSLLDLTMHALSESICEHIPRGLTKLCGGQTLMSSKLIKFLPKRLMTLKLSYAQTGDTHYDTMTGNELTVGTEMPEFPEHQDYARYLDWIGDQSLPPTLTHLELLRFVDIGDSFTQQNLPHLVHLDLKDATNFTNLALPLFSRHLTHLNLSKSSQISSDHFSHIPRGLTWLNLDSAPNIYDEELDQLPHTLGVLKIGAAHGTTVPIDALLKGLPATWPKLSRLIQELNGEE